MHCQTTSIAQRAPGSPATGPNPSRSAASCATSTGCAPASPPKRHAPDIAERMRAAILLCNLGSPDAPTPAAVRRYLAEFLGDPRVVEIPKVLWWPILHGIVLRVRPSKSAARYASIWTTEGSPLKVWTGKQAKMLRGYLGQRGHRVAVKVAMRYGSPAIPAVLDELRADGVE